MNYEKKSNIYASDADNMTRNQRHVRVHGRRMCVCPYSLSSAYTAHTHSIIYVCGVQIASGTNTGSAQVKD